MRILVATALLLTLSAMANGQGGDKGKPVARFGVDLDIKKYPQKTPKEALGSVLKAIGERQFEYMIAYLADPLFVDQRISVFSAQLGPDIQDNKKQAAAFSRLVQSVRPMDFGKTRASSGIYSCSTAKASGRRALPPLRLSSRVCQPAACS